MKLSVLYTFFSEQELRVPMAIFKSFTFLATSQSQEPVQKIPLSPTHTNTLPFLSPLLICDPHYQIQFNLPGLLTQQLQFQEQESLCSLLMCPFIKLCVLALLLFQVVSYMLWRCWLLVLSASCCSSLCALRPAYSSSLPLLQYPASTPVNTV